MRRAETCFAALLSHSGRGDRTSVGISTWTRHWRPQGRIYSRTLQVSTKKLVDGTIDPDNARPTADFSWPVWDVALAEYVTSPNDKILMAAHPEVRWFALGDFFDQVWYLRQYGVPLE